MELFRYFPGSVPVILSIPHAGLYVPPTILGRLTEAAKRLPDTDWHVEQLYSFARALGVHVLAATHSRYVIDLNRPPDGQSLYPGKFTTGLCPVSLFDGSSLYLTGSEPTAEEIQQRVEVYWRPYHAKLQALLAELQKENGPKRVVLFDAHSICSQVPTLFEGVLPDLNLGTADGASADPQLSERLFKICQSSSFRSVHNGRFKGGYITRQYGQPKQGIDAVQLEIAQLNYMQEDYPYTFEASKAQLLQATLRELMLCLVSWAS